MAAKKKKKKMKVLIENTTGYRGFFIAMLFSKFHYV
jgi:hypothetical protein